MLKLRAVAFLFFCCVFFVFVKPASAAMNPLLVPNNKIGIHILDVSELPDAAKLVDSKGGDWGYVTIPIQSGDENLVKWQNFMNDCKRWHVIPILRLATEDDYFNTQVWRTPTEYDIVDFVNFLNSLNWPTKNRYVIVFNEVNRADEWGGNADPAAYAKLLSFAVTAFKTADDNFFIISAGLDNAAPNQGNIYMSEYSYMLQMNQAVPGIFNQVDGVASHSYPNPGFAQQPDPGNMMGIGSFVFERNLIRSISTKQLPIFITETGWSSDAVSEDTRVQYYDQAFKTIWNDPQVVAVTPFLLHAGAGPFEQFTFITASGYKTKQYQYFYNLPKVKGAPFMPPPVLAIKKIKSKSVLAAEATKDFSDYQFPQRSISLRSIMEGVFSYLINR